MADAFLEALEGMVPGWGLGQECLLGQGGDFVRLLALHDVEADGHVDVEFVIHDRDGCPVAFLDCVMGSGADSRARARMAAHRWAQTTAAAVCELAYSRRGEFADHYASTDTGGLTGWHVICGGLLPTGSAEHSRQLIDWWLQSSPLSGLAAILEADMPEEGVPHGLKILFGLEGVAEVRLNGHLHEAASDALLAMDWPRGGGAMRTYVIALHRGCSCGV